MPDKITNDLIYKTLVAVQTAIADMRDEQKRTNVRLSELAAEVRGARADINNLSGILARHDIERDAARERFEHIERRLDLRNEQ